MIDDGLLIRALGRRTDANLLEMQSYTDAHGNAISLLQILNTVHEHGGCKKVSHGKTGNIHLHCADGRQVVLRRAP
jgi:hypothetical protein